jgi:hypothetical protein
MQVVGHRIIHSQVFWHNEKSALPPTEIGSPEDARLEVIQD